MFAPKFGHQRRELGALRAAGFQRLDVGVAVAVFTDGDVFHLRRDDPLPRVVELRDVLAGLGAQRLAVQAGETQLVEFLVGGPHAAEF